MQLFYIRKKRNFEITKLEKILKIMQTEEEDSLQNNVIHE